MCPLVNPAQKRRPGPLYCLPGCSSRVRPLSLYFGDRASFEKTLSFSYSMPRNRLHHGVFLTSVLRNLLDRLLTVIGCCNPELSPSKKRNKKTVRSEPSGVTESSERVFESVTEIEEGMALRAGSVNECLLRLLELLEEQGSVPLSVNIVTRPILETFFKRNHTNFL